MSVMVVELFRALKQAGVDDQTAEAASSVVMHADVLDNFATKADILATNADLRAMKADIRADLADLRSELIRWMAGLLLAQIGIFAGLVKLIGG